VVLLLELDDALLAHDLHAVVHAGLAVPAQLGHAKRAHADPRQHVVLVQLSRLFFDLSSGLLFRLLLRTKRN